MADSHYLRYDIGLISASMPSYPVLRDRRLFRVTNDQFPHSPLYAGNPSSGMSRTSRTTLRDAPEHDGGAFHSPGNLPMVLSGEVAECIEHFSGVG